MKIEILFPELCKLYGEQGNMRYLKLCLPEAEFIETELNDEPQFLKDDVDLVYMGACSERSQEKIIEKLLPYKKEIKEKIENGLAFLCTSNSFEVFGSYIETDEGKKLPALGTFDMYAKRNLLQRHNSDFDGVFDGIRIIGSKSQFSMCYPKSEEYSFIKGTKGIGLNPETKNEGIHYKNFFATYLLGPLLINNPDFTKYLLKLIGCKNPILAFEEDSYVAYNKRIHDFDIMVPETPAKYVAF